jgi:hypothetical protein
MMYSGIAFVCVGGWSLFSKCVLGFITTLLFMCVCVRAFYGKPDSDQLFCLYQERAFYVDHVLQFIPLVAFVPIAVLRLCFVGEGT